MATVAAVFTKNPWVRTPEQVVESLRHLCHSSLEDLRRWPVATAPAPAAEARGGPRFGEQARKDLNADEVRFTTKGGTIYAFVMGWPEREALIKPPGTNSAGMKVANVSLLGFKGKLQWTQGAEGLTVQMPPARPCDYAITLKITSA